MSYYENPQWSSSPSPSNWDSGASTPVRAGANGPQPQDEFAFSCQFDEVDRAHENLQKSGKGYGMNGRRGRPQHLPGSRPHSVTSFDESRGPPGANLHNFYAAQRHQPPRGGGNDAEQVIQAKRRMAAQRERELRNMHTEQQYQRNTLSDVGAQGGPPNNPPVPVNPGNNSANNNNKHMSEEETRELIARQRSALYGEGQFADKTSYVDESGNVRTGAPGTSGPSSIRGHSPLTFDNLNRGPPGGADAATPGSATDASKAAADLSPRPQSTSSPQSSGPNNKVFENAVGSQSRTNASSPTGGSPPRDFAPGSKPNQANATVAPIGTRPTGTPGAGAQSQAKRSTTPLAPGSGWGRGNGVWGQSSSGLGTQASVWG